MSQLAKKKKDESNGDDEHVTCAPTIHLQPINGFDWNWTNMNVTFAQKFDLKIDVARFRQAILKLAGFLPAIAGRINFEKRVFEFNGKGVKLVCCDGPWSEAAGADDWCAVFTADDCRSGKCSPVSFKLTFTPEGHTVIGMCATHFFDGYSFYDMFHQVLRLYSGEEIVPPTMFTDNDWLDALPLAKLSKEDAEALIKKEGMATGDDWWASMKPLPGGQGGYIHHWQTVSTFCKVHFTRSELDNMKKACKPDDAPFISTYKSLVCVMTQLLCEICGIEKVRTQHLVDIRDRAPFFPRRSKNYYANGLSPTKVVLPNGQAPLKELAAQILGVFNSPQEMDRQMNMTLGVSAALQDLVVIGGPSKVNPTDGSFTGTGKHDGPLFVFNSHMFGQEKFTVEGQRPSAMVGARLATPCLFFGALDGGVDMFLSLPAKYATVFNQQAYQNKLHRFR